MKRALWLPGGLAGLAVVWLLPARAGLPQWGWPTQRLRLAIWLAASSPEFNVLRQRAAPMMGVHP